MTKERALHVLAMYILQNVHAHQYDDELNGALDVAVAQTQGGIPA